MKARVENLSDLVGQAIVNARDRKIYLITAVGTAGVTTHQIDDDGKQFGPEVCITWRAFKALYSLVVRVEDVDDGKLVKP